eukprot:3717245-Rhodomonas_salina.1
MTQAIGARRLKPHKDRRLSCGADQGSRIEGREHLYGSPGDGNHGVEVGRRGRLEAEFAIGNRSSLSTEHRSGENEKERK